MNRSRMVLSIRKKDLIGMIPYSVLLVYLVFNAVIRLISRTGLTLNIWRASMVVAGMLGMLKLIKCRERLIYLYVLSMIVCYAMEVLLRSEWRYSLFDFISSLSMMGIAYILVSTKNSLKIYRYLYYGICAVILYRLFVLNVPIRTFMLDITSYNFISIFTLFYLTLYLIVKIQHNLQPAYVDVILYLIISVVAYGRGGIVSAFLLIFVTVLLKSYTSQKGIRTYFWIVAIFFIIVLFGNSIISRISELNYFSKFRKLGLETGRFEIWKTYWSYCMTDWRSIICGASPYTTVYTGNLHNSFLQLYASLGLLFLIITIVLLIRASIFYIKDKDYWLIAIAVVFFCRIFTDKVMYNSYGEIIMYYYIFNYARKRKRRVKERR